MAFYWLLAIGFPVMLPATLASNGVAKSQFTETLLSQSTYDNKVRPGVDSGSPTVVTINAYINSLSRINEIDMDYTVNIFFRQEWRDERLAFTQYNETLTLNYNQFSRLWVPDAFFRNEKQSTFHDITVPNRLLSIAPDGTVLYSQRLSLTLMCDMHLGRYPMDNQTCPMQIETYGYTTKDLVFRWREKEPIQVTDSLTLPEFVLSDYVTGDCTVGYITGAFSCIDVHFRLGRQFEYYLIQTYVPSMLIVMLSWVSFWIDMHAVPARITLGLLTVLTMTTQSSGVSQRLPRVSYIKAIDVWMTTCLAFVFGGLIEYSIVNVLARKHDKMKKKKEQEEASALAASVGEVNISLEVNGKENGSDPDKVNTNHERPLSAAGGLPRAKPSWFVQVKTNRALLVDVISRILFPSVFVVFNIVYWLTYA